MLRPSAWRDMEWFRPPGILCDDGSYGGVRGFFRTHRKLHLLDLGKYSNRALVVENTSLSSGDMHPDAQWSGHTGNLKIHRAILGSKAFRHYDGTYIIETDVDDEELEMSEVVLFVGRCRSALTLERLECVD